MGTIYKVGYDTDPGDYPAGGDYDGTVLSDRMQTPSAVQALNHLRANQTIPGELRLSCRNSVRLAATDFPVISMPIDIMSRRLVDAIGALGSSDWTLIPAVFVDDAGRALPGEFQAVYFNEFPDFLDRDLSEFTPAKWTHVPEDHITEAMKRQIRQMQKMVLQAPEEGLPPLFRLESWEMALYASEACRDAVLEGGFKGIRFDACGEVRS